MITESKKALILQYFLPILFGIGVLGILTYYKLNFGIRLMESDSASDICYAHLLSEEGSIISNNYYFSTALRIFDNELIFALLFRLFPRLGWWEIETIGTVLMNGLIGMASVLLAYQLGLGKKSLWLFGLSLLPYGESQFFYVLMHGCGYYGYAIFQVYLILSLYLGIVNFKKENRTLLWIEWVCYLGISILAGIQGVRLLENLYIPLFLCSIGAFLYQFMQKEDNYGFRRIIICFRSQKFTVVRYLKVSLFGSVMALTGYAVNSLWLRDIFTWSNMENLKWKEFSFTPIEIFVSEVLENSGYLTDLQLFSKRGIVNLIGIVLCIVIAGNIVIVCKRKIRYPQKFMINFFITAMAVHLFIYIFLMDSYRARYMLPFFMCLPHVGLVTIKEQEYGSKKIVLLILGICIILNSSNVIVTTHERGNSGSVEVNIQKEMAEFLVDNNYTYGFSTFEFGNSTVQLCDGKLDICHLVSLQTFEKYKWLCTKDEIKYTMDEKTFLIVSDKQLKDFENMSWNQKEKIIWHNGGICVFSYGSVRELQNAFIPI